MASKRKQIRDDVVTRLKAAVTEVSNRVLPSRAEALSDVQLPCICVYTRDEKVETQDSRPTVQSRLLALAVEIVVTGSGSIDDTLDDLAEKVEIELLAARKQTPASGLYSSVTLEATEIGFNDTGKKPIAAARLTFEFSYQQILS